MIPKFLRAQVHGRYGPKMHTETIKIISGWSDLCIYLCWKHRTGCFNCFYATAKFLVTSCIHILARLQRGTNQVLPLIKTKCTCPQSFIEYSQASLMQNTELVVPENMWCLTNHPPATTCYLWKRWQGTGCYRKESIVETSGSQAREKSFCGQFSFRKTE